MTTPHTENTTQLTSLKPGPVVGLVQFGLAAGLSLLATAVACLLWFILTFAAGPWLLFSGPGVILAASVGLALALGRRGYRAAAWGVLTGVLAAPLVTFAVGTSFLFMS